MRKLPSTHKTQKEEMRDQPTDQATRRQGGIISPLIFNIYVDDLIDLLRSLHVGCHLIDTFVACIFYADDLALLSPTRETMQQLLDTTTKYCTEFCISFSFKKTKMLVFGKSKEIGTPSPVFIYGEPIEIVDHWRNLGFYITSGNTLSFSAQPDLASFRRAANCLLNTFYKPSEEVMMRLLYTNCVPILSYGAQIKQYCAGDAREANVAVNDCICQIFGFNRWLSIRDLRLQAGYKSIEEIFALLNRRFLARTQQSGNPVILFLAGLDPST